MTPRIAVMGAGAVGGYVGGHLARLGHDVTLIDPWPEHVEAIRAGGLRLFGMTEPENVTVQVPAMHLTEVQRLAKERPIDVAIVSVKSYDTEWATTMIAQYLAPGGFVVSLQNCINEERIARIVGWGRVVGCIAARIAVDLTGPGEIHRTVPKGGAAHTVFRVGEVHGRVTPRVEMLAEMIAGIDSVLVTQNLWGERWSKLCVNAMRNGICAASGMTGNEAERHDGVRRFSIRVGGEAVRVGQALGYSLVNIGNLKPDLLGRAGEGDPSALEETEALVLAGSNVETRSDKQRPSMAQDMLKGRRTEIDFINGFIVDQASTIGRDAPANAALADAVRRVWRGNEQARPELLTSL